MTISSVCGEGGTPPQGGEDRRRDEALETMSDLARPVARCTVCASENASLFGRINEFTILSCHSCNHKFVWPLLTDSQVALQYGKYLERAEEAGYLQSPGASAIAVERAEIELLFKLKPGGNLLDVGSGGGTGMHWAFGLGFKVWGVEPCAELTAQARRRWGLEQVEVLEGTLTDVRHPDGFFDVVVLRSVIEHLNEPIRDLRSLRRVLKSDGILFVSTEDYDSPDARRLRAKFPYYVPPWHLNFFSQRSLRLALEAAGLKDIRLIVPGIPWFLEPYSWKAIRSNPLVQIAASRFLNRGPIMKCWASPAGLPRIADRLLGSGFPRLSRAYLHRIRAIFTPGI